MFNTINTNIIDHLKDGSSHSRKIDNLPWYRTDQIPKYHKDFAYAPPHYIHHEADELDDLGDLYEHFLIQKGYLVCEHCVQKYNSHIVPVFLNLSAIPIDVIKNIEINEYDYSLNIRPLMEEYLK